MDMPYFVYPFNINSPFALLTFLAIDHNSHYYTKYCYEHLGTSHKSVAVCFAFLSGICLVVERMQFIRTLYLKLFSFLINIY
jgi:hypothetical protein